MKDTPMSWEEYVAYYGYDLEWANTDDWLAYCYNEYVHSFSE